MYNEPYGTLFSENVPYEVDEPRYTRENWEIGFGFQKIDGLEPSKYLLELVEQQLAGQITHDQLINNLKKYYSKPTSSNDSEEADYTSARIAEILSDNSFSLKPTTLLDYHRTIFSGMHTFQHPVGRYRTENITKSENVLRGKSVGYARYTAISETLNYDFGEEHKKRYKEMPLAEIAHSVMKFISNIWQVHPFREGNTRTCGVFAVKYLRHLGFDVDNEPFKNNAKFFRDALALENGPVVLQTDKYLRMFTENAVLGGENELKIKSD